MRGLKNIPTVAQLQKVYGNLQTSSTCLPLGHLALWACWVRFDPRLGEQWIEHLQKHWTKIHPLELNRYLQKQVWPAAAGPLLEQIPLFSQWSAKERHVFEAWSTCVMSGISAMPYQLYFIGLRSFGGEIARKDVMLSLKSYVRWGFYSRELLVNKAIQKHCHTDLTPESRERVLASLIDSQDRIFVKDYIAAAGGAISIRQAQLDLKKQPNLIKVGKTKGSFYQKIQQVR